MSIEGSATARRADVAIRVAGLSKCFGDREVLRGVNFSVPRGSLFGFVGRNGAGKTTTLRALVGLLDDFEGEVRVAELDPAREPVEVRRRIGYVPERPALFDALTAAEFLQFAGRIHGCSDERIRDRSERLVEALGMRDRLDSRIAHLSRGERQKVAIASALLHEPEILLLDEPLTGLDAAAVRSFEAVLRSFVALGRTVVLCTHVPGAIETLCDHVAVLDAGTVDAAGPLAEILAGGASLAELLAGLDGSDRAGEARRLVEGPS